MRTEGGEIEASWSGGRRSASDFRRARLGAFSSRFARRMRRWMSGVPACCEDCCDSLACFGEETGNPRRSIGAKKYFDSVEVERIVGSVGRRRAFDGDFSPTCSCTRERWERVDIAFAEGKHLPPVELHKLGEKYFVYDGNHRVSVARHHKAAAIDALVTEFTAL